MTAIPPRPASRVTFACRRPNATQRHSSTLIPHRVTSIHFLLLSPLITSPSASVLGRLTLSNRDVHLFAFENANSSLRTIRKNLLACPPELAHCISVVCLKRNLRPLFLECCCEFLAEELFFGQSLKNSTQLPFSFISSHSSLKATSLLPR